MSKVEALSTSRISQVKNDVNTSDKNFDGGKSSIERLGRFIRRVAYTTKKAALFTVGPALMALGSWVLYTHGDLLGELRGTEESVSKSEANANLIGVGAASIGFFATFAGVAVAKESDSFEKKEEKRAEKIEEKRAEKIAKQRAEKIAKQRAKKGAEDKTIEYRKAVEMARTWQR